MENIHYQPVEDPSVEAQSGLIGRCWSCKTIKVLVVSTVGGMGAAILTMTAIFSIMALKGVPLTASDEIGKCALTPERMEGPFYLKEELFRAEVGENQPGLTLKLRINVTDPDCNPLPNAFVDIWQCNSTGFYSGFTADTGGGPGGEHGPGQHHGPGGGKHGHGHGGGKHGHGHGGGKGPHGPPHARQTDNLTFLRGTLLTDDSGTVEFVTTIPGWYPGRAPHIHMKVHVPDDQATHDTEAGEYADSHVSHTGQVFFPEAIYNQVETLHPYADDVHNRTHLEDDHDYHNDPTAILPLTQLDPQDMTQGFAATITILVDPASTPPIKPETGENGVPGLPSWLHLWQ